jgi:hypothetical protein
MPQRVTLSKDGHTESVIVETATLSDDLVRLEGFDPSFCPDELKDGIQFASKNLAALIYPESSVTVESVEPPDEPVPEPDVRF